MQQQVIMIEMVNGVTVLVLNASSLLKLLELMYRLEANVLQKELLLPRFLGNMNKVIHETNFFILRVKFYF